MQEENAKPRIGFARNLARKLLKDCGIEKPPVLLSEVVTFLQKRHDFSVVPWNFGERISGIHIIEKETATVGYNQAQHPHRQRFTVAHEIGHFLLGHTSSDPGFYLRSKSPEETEANQFAAELLMPLKMIKNDFSNGTKKPKTLVRMYWVSEEAIWWRLLECKLLNL